jgi:alpha-mannosidase
LMPYAGELSNADRIHAAEEFSQKLIPVLGKPQSGNLPARKGFLTVSGSNAQLLAFRKKSGSAFELRVAEVEGKKSKVSVEVALPVNGAAETNLLGHKTGQVAHNGSRLDLEIQPWRVHTIEVI